MWQLPLEARAHRIALVALLLTSATPAVAQSDTTARPADTTVAVAPIASVAPRIEVATDSAALADSVRQVARWLVANGASEARARTVAVAVMHYARLRTLDPLLIVGIIGVENAALVPRARSRAGARGVMQVMPSWKHDIPDCGRDMHDVRVNVCLGTAVLRIALDASKTVREALLRYNGCVRAPGCNAYATAVFGRSGYALLMSRQPWRVATRESGEGQ
jgi:soluble lytic murein transglycosylase-like protein